MLVDSSILRTRRLPRSARVCSNTTSALTICIGSPVKSDETYNLQTQSVTVHRQFSTKIKHTGFVADWISTQIKIMSTHAFAMCLVENVEDACSLEILTCCEISSGVQLAVSKFPWVDEPVTTIPKDFRPFPNGISIYVFVLEAGATDTWAQ